MFKQNIYLVAILLLSCTSTLTPTEVKARIQLEIGDKIEELDIIVDDNKYTRLKMDNENLGFKIKLLAQYDVGYDATFGTFRTKITHNEKPISAQFLATEKRIDAGTNIDGHIIEKKLAMKTLSMEFFKP